MSVSALVRAYLGQLASCETETERLKRQEREIRSQIAGFRALALLDDDAGSLSIEVLQECYVQATRSSRVDAVPHDLAVGLIEAWSRLRRWSSAATASTPKT